MTDTREGSRRPWRSPPRHQPAVDQVEGGWFINDLDGLSVAVVHGSPWRYDTYVPILFARNGIKPQAVSRQVHTVDVAITLSTVVGSRPPSGAAGEALLEVLGQ